MSEILSIGRLGKLADTKTETIRYYEKIGLLLPPSRSAGNYRSYSEKDLRRLQFIRRSRALGFSIETIRGLLGVSSGEVKDRKEVRAIAKEHLIEVEDKISQLQILKKQLEDLIKQCPKGHVSGCGIIDALNGDI